MEEEDATCSPIDSSATAKESCEGGSATHRLLDEPHITIEAVLGLSILLNARLLELAPRREEEEDSLDGLRDEREEVLVEREQVLERERAGREADRACPLKSVNTKTNNWRISEEAICWRPEEKTMGGRTHVGEHLPSARDT